MLENSSIVNNDKIRISLSHIVRENSDLKYNIKRKEKEIIESNDIIHTLRS